MNEVTFRPFLETDSPRAKELIDQAFYIHRYLSKKELLDSALEIYLRECLASSTYSEVAVVDDRVVGLVLAEVSGQPRLPSSTWNNLIALRHIAKIATYGFSDISSHTQFLQMNATYRALKRDVYAPLTDELCLFIVDEEMRGKGIGKKLFNTFKGHLRSNGRKDFYLFTDSLCTYGFYDKHGMNRLAAREITVTLDGKPEPLEVFLYTGKA